MQERIRSGIAAAKARQAPSAPARAEAKSDRLAPKVLVAAGRSYRLISRELGSAKIPSLKS
jgi:hypothetical protein